MSTDLPYMPIFVRDVLAEVSDLDAEERGVLWSLMFECWKEAGSLPLDLKRLARRAGIDPVRLEAAIWPVIGRYFEVDGEVIRHPKVTAEIARAVEMYEARRRGAAKTNAQRSAQRTLSDAEATRSAHRSNGRSGVGIPSPSPSPSPSPDPTPTLTLTPSLEEGGGDTAPSGPAPPPLFDAFWSMIKAGNNGMGTKSSALAESRRQGEPPPEVLVEKWTAYLASVPEDGKAMVPRTWLAERGWDQQWDAAPAPRRPMTRFDKQVLEHQQMTGAAQEFADEHNAVDVNFTLVGGEFDGGES